MLLSRIARPFEFIMDMMRSGAQIYRGWRQSLKFSIEFLRLLSNRMRLYLLLREVLTYVSIVLDFIGILSIVPFLGLVANPEVFAEKAWLIRISEFLGSPSTNWLMFYLGLISLSLLLIRHVFSYFATIVSLWLGQQLTFDVKSALLNYYIHSDYAEHLQENTGLLHRNVYGRADAVIGQMVFGTSTMVNASFYFMVGATIVMIQDPVLTFFGLGLVGFALIAYAMFNERKRARLDRQINALENRNMVEGLGVFHMIEDIKVQRQEKRFFDNIKAQIRTSQWVVRQQEQLTFLLAPILEVTLYGVVVLTIGFYAWSTSTTASITSLALFGLISYRTLPHYRNFYAAYSMMQRGVLHYEIIRNDLIQAYKYTQSPKRTAKTLGDDWGELQFKKVCYRYKGTDANAVDKIDFSLPRGAFIGFCGVSGSGKSTLARLLLSLLHPTAGKIQLDGKPLSDDLLEKWKNSLSYVSQSLHLMDGDMVSNISFVPVSNNRSADLDKINRAVKAACLQELVDAMPKGIHTPLGENAKMISGGQRQRIALARALYHDAPIMILDESTSALDSKTEKAVMDSIRNAKDVERTVVLIAHRINTLRFCDTIYAMRKGRIVASGDYQTLFRESKYFRELTGEEA